MDTIEVSRVNFSYPGTSGCIHDCSFNLPKGSRCLLTGANGAGKTTLLQLVAGKYMVPEDKIRVLGRPPFHDLGDVSAGKMIYGVEGVDPERRTRLVELLDIDPYWHLNRVSDGQRRRVQICMGLLKPYDVLLMDEITVDLDVVARLDLLQFFKQECEERGVTILYATHIFDGLENWTTHLAYMEDGRLVTCGPKEDIKALRPNTKLLNVVEAWLRVHHERTAAAAEAKAAQPQAVQPTPTRTPIMPSKHLAFFR